MRLNQAQSCYLLSMSDANKIYSKRSQKVKGGKEAMKIVIIVLLSGLIALPLLSWAIFGNVKEILPWFYWIGGLAVIVIVISLIKKTKVF